MPRYDRRRAGSDTWRASGTMPRVGEPQRDDGVVTADFAVIRETIRMLADRSDPEEQAEAVEPMEG